MKASPGELIFALRSLNKRRTILCRCYTVNPDNLHIMETLLIS